MQEIYTFSARAETPTTANYELGGQIEKVHNELNQSQPTRIESIHMSTFAHDRSYTYTAIVVFESIPEMIELTTTIEHTDDPCVEILAAIEDSLNDIRRKVVLGIV